MKLKPSPSFLELAVALGYQATDDQPPPPAHFQYNFVVFVHDLQ